MEEAAINIIAANSGSHLSIAGGQYRVLVSGAETGDRYAVIEMNVPPGGGPPPHQHPEIEELFYVAEGELEFKTAAGKMHVKQGANIRIPLNGGVHCFKNITDKPARLLCTVLPAGLDTMFTEISSAKPDEIPGIMSKYRQTVYPPNYLDK